MEYKKSLTNIAKMNIQQGDTLEECKKNLKPLCRGDEDMLNEIIHSLDSSIKNIDKIIKPTGMQKENAEKWYTGPDEGSVFWNGFKEKLINKGWDSDTINSVDDATSKILSKTPPPIKVEYSSKGLVLGYVQSGKTTNYTGVIAKALDTEYQIVIVLAGLTNSLRRQTQDRLNEDLVSVSPKQWMSLTDHNRDFSSGISWINFQAILKNRDNNNTKFLIVVKKNAAILRNLITWIEGQKPSDLGPTLIIDDEADNASINTGKGESELERSTINRLIISLINKFPKISYIAYTATPFANILCDTNDINDLYPRDFIISLEKPDNYIGAEEIFGREKISHEESESVTTGLNIINFVPKDQAQMLSSKKKKQKTAIDLTNSLKDAINYFICASAAKKFRIKKKSNTSMLIHTSYLTDKQIELGQLINDYLSELKNDFILDKNKILGYFEKIWEDQIEMEPASTFGKQIIDFSEISDIIYDIIQNLKVIVQNYRTEDDILEEYEQEEKSYIVIGGNTLSRGLTLRGLLVSYFLRVARNYDTLLQMGRWFGYHDKYIDLVRLWMTEELYEYFVHLATVEQEIRNDIQVYEYSTDITPLNFAPRIRSHKRLRITSRSKMRNAIPTSKSFSGKKIETKYFNTTNKDILQKNIEITKELLTELNDINIPKQNGNRFIFYDVSLNQIIHYLEKYSIHENSTEIKSSFLVNYLNEHGTAYNLWNVIVFSNPNSNRGTIDLGLTEEIPLLNRARSLKNDQYAYIKGIVSKSDLIADLQKNENQFYSLKDVGLSFDEDTKKLNQYQITTFRETIAPKTGLLLIYPIAKDSEPTKSSKKSFSLNACEDVIGIGLYFPLLDFVIPKDYFTANIKPE